VKQSHVFGLVGSISHALHYIDDQHLAYPAGSGIIIYNVEQKTQRFLTLLEGGNVTAMCATSRLIAVAEQNEKRATVSIYDTHSLKRKKVIRDDENQSKVIIVPFKNPAYTSRSILPVSNCTMGLIRFLRIIFVGVYFCRLVS
jgi:hypothetical protein